MVSVVIPTYNRKESLIRLIQSINNQSYPPKEIIIVKAGEEQLENVQKLNNQIKIISSSPSVCKQRNIGIHNANSKYILLCDDDIELPNNYIESLLTYIEDNKDVKIVTGTELQQNTDKKWKEIQTKITGSSLIYNYIFGLSICTNLIPYKNSNNFILRRIIKHYDKNKNGISKSGWPLLTHFDYPIMETTIYGLGCSMIKREILLKNLYNEELDPNGIGDNYEVALKINGLSDKIHVLRDVTYKHFKDTTNRYLDHISYFKRCIGLHSFLKKLPCFNLKNRLYFIWSLIGNSFRFLVKGNIYHFKLNQKIIFISIINLFKS